MSEWISAGTVEEIVEAGYKQVRGGLVVFAHEGELYAIENRCPHMGFPLHMGSLCDGILTCHWHHARFDVCSGGTLDPWADDVPAHDIKIEDNQVYVNRDPKTKKDIARHIHRLQEGLQQNISLIIAKSVIALVEAGVSEADIAKVGILFGTSQRSNGWGSGLTILTAMVNVLPKLDAYGRILALFHGLVHVARDSAGHTPHYMLQPLPDTAFSTERLSEWYRQSIEVRDTQGAERVLLAAIGKGADTTALADMMTVAATDHFYLDGGHTFDFHNKAFEALEWAGNDTKEQVLTSLVPILGNPTRSEELQNWRSPVNLVEPLQEAFTELNLNQSFSATPGKTALGQRTLAETTQLDFDDAAFVAQVLSDTPQETVMAITKALRSGVSPAHVAQLVTLAAAERIMKFHVQNDFGDWIAVLHTFTHAHAVHERILSGAHPNVYRAIYHSAMRIYLDRFLNIPSAPLPNGGKGAAAGYTKDLTELLAIMDQRQQVAESANWVAHYLTEQEDVPALLNTLGHALLREDAEFHSFQMYEAAVKEYDRWATSDSDLRETAQQTLLFALTRYLAAHAPTSRELPHVARIAWRLQRGEKLFEEQ